MQMQINTNDQTVAAPQDDELGRRASELKISSPRWTGVSLG